MQAATRGDGSRGDDVTAAALLSHAVPSHLPSMLPSGQPVPSLLEVSGLHDNDDDSATVFLKNIENVLFRFVDHLKRIHSVLWILRCEGKSTCPSPCCRL